MGIQILDGTGKGFLAIVDSEGHLIVDALTFEDIAHVSLVHGDTYMTTSIDTAAANEYNFYFKNDSTTQNFFVKEIIVGSAELAIFKVATVTGTAGGTPITPRNLNRTSGHTASATAFGDAAVTSLTEEHLLITVSVGADESEHIDFHSALVLGQGDAIAVEYDVGAGATMHVTMLGYFE